MTRMSCCCHVEVAVTLFGPSRSDTRKDMQPTISFLPKKSENTFHHTTSGLSTCTWDQRLEKVEI